MSQIQKLYEMLLMANEQDDLSLKADASICDIADKVKIAEEEEKGVIQSLIFEASCVGQEYGFIQGFKFAVVLMAECFN